MRDKRRTNNKQVKIELLSQWKLGAGFRDFQKVTFIKDMHGQYHSMVQKILFLGVSKFDDVPMLMSHGLFD